MLKTVLGEADYLTLAFGEQCTGFESVWVVGFFFYRWTWFSKAEAFSCFFTLVKSSLYSSARLSQFFQHRNLFLLPIPCKITVKTCHWCDGPSVSILSVSLRICVGRCHCSFCVSTCLNCVAPTVLP